MSGVIVPYLLQIVLQAMGYLSVSVFFFMSGYGLMAQYDNRGEEYLNSFPHKRLLPYYCNYVVLIIVYAVLNLIAYRGLDFIELFKSFVWDGKIVKNGWYLLVLLWYYIGFYVVFKFLKNEKYKLPMMFVLLVVYCVFCSAMDYSTTRYEASFAFLFGFVWHQKRQWIWSEIDRHYTGSLVLSFIGFSGTFLLGNTSLIGSFSVIAKMGSCIAFVALVMIMIAKLPIQNKLSRVLGNYYFEIYVMQGVPLLLFHSDLIYIENDLLYVLATVVVTAVLAVVIHPLFRFINTTVKRREVAK